ncbi:MAG: hypothetical protein D6785_02815 [Planctomycetota bacterium]|nr:MAG: hypothetical protein D6785_02815 [Planctomycetota bacterium]
MKEGHPSLVPEVTIGGKPLKIDDFIAVARYHAKVCLSPEVIPKIRLCRTVVDTLVDNREVAYGITTGFGALRDILIPPEETATLQMNLIRSHAAGTGKPFSYEVVRGALLLRANTLAMGNSGVRIEIIEALLQLLNLGIYPYVPEKGSLGASGDLAPLSHLALVLMGDKEGRFLPKDHGIHSPSYKDFLPSTKEELEKHGFQPLSLKAKEGLALNNGTQFITALGAFLVWDGTILLESAKTAFAMSMEANKSVLDCLNPNLYHLRPQKYHGIISQEIYQAIHESPILSHPLNFAYLQKGQTTLEQILSWKEEEVEEEVFSEIHLLLKKWKDFIEKASQKEIPSTLDYDARRNLFEEDIHNLQSIISRIQISLWGKNSLFHHKIGNALNLVLQDLSQALPLYRPVQDDYSFRCAIQVLAALQTALQHVREIIEIELNSVTDNPILFPPKWQEFIHQEQEYSGFLKSHPDLLKSAVVSGGNFHGIPLGIPLDYLSIALSEIASIAERRIAHFLDTSVNKGLPSFLSKNPGLESGFMIPQYTAAAVVSENKVLSHPASVDSIPTSANREDYVSMATFGARKALEILHNCQYVIALEILSAAQALEFRKPLLPSSFTQRVLRHMESKGWHFISGDPPLEREVARILESLKKEELVFQKFLNPKKEL